MLNTKIVTARITGSINIPVYTGGSAQIPLPTRDGYTIIGVHTLLTGKNSTNACVHTEMIGPGGNPTIIVTTMSSKDTAINNWTYEATITYIANE